METLEGNPLPDTDTGALSKRNCSTTYVLCMYPFRKDRLFP